MSDRLRVLRLVIVLGYVVVGLGVALRLFGPYALIALPAALFLLSEPVINWITDNRARQQLRTEMMTVGRDALTSDQMDRSFRERAPIVIDDDPVWGKFVEGRDPVWGNNLAAVQVTNSTPEPDGTHKKVWLRVPSRGDRMGTRVCMAKDCGRDISWPPRSAREAVAWTFRMCTDHYQPAKAS